MFSCRNLRSMSFLEKTSRTLEEFFVSAIRWAQELSNSEHNFFIWKLSSKSFHNNEFVGLVKLD